MTFATKVERKRIVDQIVFVFDRPITHLVKICWFFSPFFLSFPSSSRSSTKIGHNSSDKSCCIVWRQTTQNIFFKFRSKLALSLTDIDREVVFWYYISISAVSALRSRQLTANCSFISKSTNNGQYPLRNLAPSSSNIKHAICLAGFQIGVSDFSAIIYSILCPSIHSVIISLLFVVVIAELTVLEPIASLWHCLWFRMII